MGCVCQGRLDLRQALASALSRWRASGSKESNTKQTLSGRILRVEGCAEMRPSGTSLMYFMYPNCTRLGRTTFYYFFITFQLCELLTARLKVCLTCNSRQRNLASASMPTSARGPLIITLPFAANSNASRHLTISTIICFLSAS